MTPKLPTPSRPRARTRARALALARVACALACTAAAVIAVAAGASPASGASTSSSTVAVTVPSATSLDASLCATGQVGRTEFGTVMPGSSAVTTADCQITFGSSNDTATLRMYQSDLTGVAMYRDTIGTVDPTWGTNGFVRSDLGSTEFDLYSGAVQSDGKIIVGGSRNGDWLIARYNANGTLDTTFNSPNGYRTVATSAGASEWISSIVIQPDGKIVAVGASNSQLAAARFTSAGLLDTAGFNSPTGFLRYDLPGGSPEDPASVALQSTGRIILAGASNSWTRAYVLGITSAGALDTTFSGGDGSNGYDSTNIPYDSATSILVDGSDRVYVASFGTCGCDQYVTRFTSAGALDTPWATSGVFQIVRSTAYGADATFAHTEFGTQAMKFDRAGRILLTGNVGRAATGTDLTVARILPATGTIDTSFAGDGTYTLPLANTQTVNSIYEMGDGSLLIGGDWNDGVNDSFFTARVTSTGTTDTTYGTAGSGWATVQPSDAASNYEGQLLMHTDGTATMVGGTSGGDVRLARFGGSPISDYTNLGGGGDTDWSSSTSTTNMFGACLRDLSGGAVTGAGTWVADSATVGDEPAVSADCGDGDSDPWNALAVNAGAASALIARTPSTVANGVANVRFGFRPSTTQPAGRYVANLTIDVVAPAV